MDPVFFKSLRRSVSVLLAAAVFSQAALADAALSSVWTERRGAIRQAPRPLSRAAVLAGAAGEERLPAGFSFASAIPAHLGTMRTSGAAAGRKAVLLIQDIHLNGEAQGNIAGAVSALLESRAVGVIGLEGAEGDLGLKDYAPAPRPASLALAADFLLGKHQISGAARAAITSPAADRVIGVDDAALHHRNAEAYRRASVSAETVLKSIHAVRARTAATKAAFKPDLRAFDAAVQSYRSGGASFSGHAAMLAGTARRLGLPVPQPLDRFVALAAAERRIDAGAVERERSAVIRRLAAAVDPASARRLLDLGNAFRDGLIRHSAFYAEFGAICRRQGLDLAGAPALSGYLRYIADADRLDPDATLKAADDLEASVYRALCRTPHERQAVRADRRVHLAGRLAAFEMTRPEWEEYKAGESRELSSQLAPFEDFYRRAVERDAAIADNLRSAMIARSADRAALVVGGFHTDGVVRLLARHGIAATVFTPALSRMDDAGSGYLSVFNREKSSVEQLLEGRALFLAQHPAPPAATFTLAHMTAGQAIAAGADARDQTAYLERTTGWTVNGHAARNGLVSFDETDPRGRPARIEVDGVRADGFTPLATVAESPRRPRRWAIGRAVRSLLTRGLSAGSRLLRRLAAALEPAPLTADDERKRDLLSVPQPARPSDWISVQDIRRKGLPGAYFSGEFAYLDSGEDDLHRDFSAITRKRLRGVALVVRDDHRVVGYVIGKVKSDGRAILSELMVHEDHQHRGHGKALFSEAVRVLLEAYPSIRQIDVSDGNPLRLTTRIATNLGFREIRPKELRLLVTPENRHEILADVGSRRLPEPILPFLRERFSDRTRISFADFETGTGRFVAAFHALLERAFPVVEAVGIDSRQKQVSEADESIFLGSPEVSGDYERAGLADASRDIVTINAIESKIPALIDQAARVVRPDGLIIITFERYDIPLGDRVDLAARRLLEEKDFVVEERPFPADYPRSDVFEQYDDLVLIAHRPPGQDGGGQTGPPPSREAPRPIRSLVRRIAKGLGTAVLAWKAAVIEVRRTLDPVTFVLKDHKNREFWGLQKRAVGVGVIHAAMIAVPFKLGVYLAAATSLDPALIILFAVLSAPVANILAHGTVNTVWLMVYPVHVGLSRLANQLEAAALREMMRLSANLLQPAPLVVNGPEEYAERLRDYLSTISSADEAVDDEAPAFGALADETASLIQGPKVRANILPGWLAALSHTRQPFELFLVAFFQRWIGREPQNIFARTREIMTLLSQNASMPQIQDLEGLVAVAFSRASTDILHGIFHELRARKSSQPLRILEITPEVAPFRKAGGMGMVNGALPLEFNRFHGWATTFSMQYDEGDYSGAEVVTIDGRPGSPPLRFTVEIPGETKARVGTAIKIRRATADGKSHADFYFFRDTTKGETNLSQEIYMRGFPEELKYKQAVFLSEGALQLMKMLVKSEQMKKPDVVRAHDWQAGLAPIYMKTRAYAEDADMREVIKGVRTMGFFHNLEPGYRGEFAPRYWHLFGLRDEDKQGFGWENARRRDDGGHDIEGFSEHKLMITKAMGHHLDALFVPSPTYALMVRTSEYGHDMAPIFEARHDALRGVLNGTDYDATEPKVFPMGLRPLDDFIDQKRRAKIRLLQELRHSPKDPSMWDAIFAGVKAKLGPDASSADIVAGMQAEIDRPIVGAVVRLDVAMKGTNMYLALVRKLTKENEDGQHIRFVLLGSKENADTFVTEMRQEAEAAPDRIFFLPEGGRPLSQPVRDINLGGPIVRLNDLIEAGIDIPAYPSKVEPCGLSDVQGWNRGGVVVVSAAGGFKDKNVDLLEETDDIQPTGVMFGPVFGDDRPKLKAISAPFTDEGFVSTVERLLDVYYNDRGRFNRIGAGNKNRRVTNLEMAREHVLAISFFTNRTDLLKDPRKPSEKMANGAVAAWRAIGIGNPVWIGALEGALTIVAMAAAIAGLMPLGPPTLSWLAVSTLLSSSGVLALFWTAHYFFGILETDGSVARREAGRATAATITAASALIAVPLLLAAVLAHDPVLAIRLALLAAAVGGLVHGGANAVAGRLAAAIESSSPAKHPGPGAASSIAAASADDPARPSARALSAQVAKALVARISDDRQDWQDRMERDIAAQATLVGVEQMAERALPSLAPMNRPDFDQTGFLTALRHDLESLGASHSADPEKARAAAEAVSFSGLSRVPAQDALAALDERRLSIIVFDGMNEADALRALARLRRKPEARALVVYDPLNAKTAALVAAASALGNVRTVAEHDAFEAGLNGGRRLVVKAVERRLKKTGLLRPSLQLVAGRALEIDLDGLGADSPFRAALYTILDALASMTVGFNRMSLLDVSHRLIASQA